MLLFHKQFFMNPNDPCRNILNEMVHFNVHMDSQHFLNRLSDAQDLMSKEDYEEAIVILEELKKIEQKGDFDYALTHKLYQLLSNAHSLYNQHALVDVLSELSKGVDSISFSELQQELKVRKGMDLEVSILKREVELLILRDLIQFGIDEDRVKF